MFWLSSAARSFSRVRLPQRLVVCVVALVLGFVSGLAQVGWVVAFSLRCCLHFVGKDKGVDLLVELGIRLVCFLCCEGFLDEVARCLPKSAGGDASSVPRLVVVLLEARCCGVPPSWPCAWPLLPCWVGVAAVLLTATFGLQARYAASSFWYASKVTRTLRASVWSSFLGEVRQKLGHLKSDAQRFLRLVRGPCLGCFALEALEGRVCSDLAQLYYWRVQSIGFGHVVHGRGWRSNVADV